MSETKFPSPFYRVAAKAIIRNEEGEILLVKERSDAWSIPGGGLDHGEGLREAIKREVKEELGVDTTSIEEKPCFSFSAINTQFDVWCLAVCFDTKIASDAQFDLSDGSTEAKYFSPEAIKHDIQLEEADAPLVHYI